MRSVLQLTNAEFNLQFGYVRACCQPGHETVWGRDHSALLRCWDAIEAGFGWNCSSFWCGRLLADAGARV
jgi:hypothetical protein